MKYWFPHDHKHLDQLMIDIEHHTGSSERTFPGTVFSMIAFNLGEQSCMVMRRCVVTATGDFDATQGGHMVLYDLHLLVKFLPGWMAIFPSGLLNHANTSLQTGETRTSIIQYTPGQLSQFRNSGWRTQTSMSMEELAVRWDEKRAIRARFAESFLTLDKVKQRHAGEFTILLL
ncbi:hypothetical protein GGX14DRAFT_372970 [Mycena pura]|uniref:Uncharacterized protein n=1 Tax=Mycena pura TaxID=153505 RepID=A0AAD6V507_9AGAR|nr:hypothetical protein GGX14DRAFT_372970 [Mycena pura]